MKDRRDRAHADCPVRYRARGLTLCGATDTPCEYCADREPNSPTPDAIGLTCSRRRKPRRNRNRNRNTPPFEDS